MAAISHCETAAEAGCGTARYGGISVSHFAPGFMTAAASPLVDAHAHVYTTDMPLAPTAWHRPPEDATVERYDQTLESAGVRYGVIAGASIYGDYNDYVIDAVRANKRLRATVIVKPDIDPYILRLMKDDGVVGIRLQWRNVASPPDLTTYEYRRLLRRVADLDWHVHLHDDGPRLPAPIAALEASGVKLVIDHFGRPDPKHGMNCAGFQAVLRSVERGRTWVKLSAGYRLEPPALAETLARELLKVAGPERLLWGSDWPFAAFENKVRYADTIADFARWVPDPVLRDQIAGETAMQLYFT
jgi:predicted TIM-barrel fold metal-dependent hydrolase